MIRLVIIFFLFLTVSCNSDDKEASTEQNIPLQKIDGEKLFKSYCASCHRADKDFTGPKLKGSLKRWGNKKSMYDFIRNPSTSQTPYAKALKKKWEPVIMTAFNLSDAQIDALMNYWENTSP